MTQTDPTFGSLGATGGLHYLEATVHAASPARLRLMLIERAVSVAGQLAAVWKSDQFPGSNEYSTQLLDLINELLSGVVGDRGEGGDKLCRQVADLYVFLAQHLIAAESTSDAGAIDEIKTVLEVEAETWRAVCAQPPAGQTPQNASQSGLNLEG